MKNYNLYATSKTLSNYHILKINGPEIKLNDNPLLTLARHIPQKEEEIPEEEMDIKVGGEKFDASKVAGGNVLKRVFKKKNKSFYFERDMDTYDKNDPHDGIAGLKKQKEDPDLNPMILHAGNMEFEGRVEGSQTSSYPDGFDVIPANKWYKFNQKKTYHTLSIDEAEQKLAVRGGLKQSDRWLMHSKKGKVDDEEEEERGGTFLKAAVPALKVSDAADDIKKVRRGRRARDELAEELDFEEDFQDDDGLMELGIEDEEDRKEATSRTFGGARTKSRINFDDEEDESTYKRKDSSNAKKLKKSLAKIEKVDVFDSDEDKDPYASDELDRLLSGKDKEIPIKTELPAEPVLKRKPEAEGGSNSSIFMKKQRRTDSNSPPGNGSPSQNTVQKSRDIKIRRGSSTSPPNESITKIKIKASASTPGAASSAPSNTRIKLTLNAQPPPPPPTAKEVLAAVAHRRVKQSSKSPPNNSTSYSPKLSSGTATPERHVKDDDYTVVLEGVVDIIRANEGITVNKLVQLIQPLFKGGIAGDNKAMLKSILKKVAVRDKDSGAMSLNESFKK